MVRSVVILGAGQAGAQAAYSLRQGGFDGAIDLVGAEAEAPYQRPPLSKAFLLGTMSAERLLLRPRDWYAAHAVTLHLSRSATAIDRRARRVRLDDGGDLAFDRLIIATGSRPRPLPVPGSELAGVLDLRSIADVERLRPLLVTGARVAIVGAGYIGLEVAAVLRSLGHAVTVLEQADRVLARVTSPVMSAFYTAEHRARGVAILTSVCVEAIVGRDGAVTGVRLSDGRVIDADIVLSGIGILPNDMLARDAGLDCGHGIVVDDDARTSDPAIFAAGDCTSRPLVHYGRHGRLESVHNAIEQGKLAAAAILGQPRPALECPWFWSDQYDLKLQIAGLSHGHDRTVMRGDQAARKFAVFYYAGRQLLAVDAVNSAPEYIVAKRALEAGGTLDPDLVADQSLSMKEIGERAKGRDLQEA